MKQVKLKAKVIEADKYTIEIEFGRIQAGLWLSGSGKAARTLKLQDGDPVEVTIRKV